MNMKKNESLLKKLFKTRWSIKKIACAMLVPLGIAAVVMVFVLSSQVALMDTLPVCGLEEHTHIPDCYESVSETGTPTEIQSLHIICGLEEHTHDEECYANEETFPDIILSSAPAGFSSDLTDFVASPIVIKDSLGNAAASFEYGKSYDFYITFAEKDLLQFYYDDESGDTFGYLYYQLPPELVIVQAVSNQPIYSTTYPTIRIGTYNISSSGLVTANFDNVQKNGQPATQSVYDEESDGYINISYNFIDFYTDADFTLKISAEFSKYGNNVKIDFGTDVNITINIESPPGATLAVSKSLISYDPATKTVIYSVSVTARNGAVKNINLRDYMQGGPFNTILNPNGRISNVTLTSGSPSLNSPPVSYESNNQYFNIALKGVLAQDYTATVQYAVDISPWVNAVADPDNYNFSNTNYVSATGNDAVTNASIGPVNAQITWTVQYQATNLSAGKTMLNYDPSTKTARFSVTVSALYGDINSINLSDKLYLDGAYLDLNGKISNVTVSSPGNVLSTPVVTYPDSETFNIELTGTLAKGNTATVAYTVDLSSFVGSGEYSLQYTNYVSVTAKDFAGRNIGPADALVSGIITYNNASLSVTKSLTKYDPATKTAVFRVDIRTVGGNISNINLRDRLYFNGAYLNLNGKISNVVVTPGLLTLNSTPVTYESNNQYFNIALNGTLSSGATATVTYTVDLSSAVSSGDPGNYVFSFTNYVSVTAKDIISGQTIGPVDAQVSGTVSYNKATLNVTKSLVSYDPATKTASFRVNVTASGGDIYDILLRDNLTVNGTVINPNGLISNVAVTQSTLSLDSPAVVYEIDNQHFSIKLNGTLRNGTTATVTYTADVSQSINAIPNQGSYDVSYINRVSVNAKDVISEQTIGPVDAQVSGNFSYRKASLSVKKALTGYDPATNLATFNVSVTANGQDVNNINLRDRLQFDGAFINPAGIVSVVSVSPSSFTAGTVTYESNNQYFNIPLTGTLSKGSTVTVTYTVDLSSMIGSNGIYNYPIKNYVDITADDVISGVEVTGSGEGGGNISYTKPTLSVKKSQTGNNTANTATFTVQMTASGGSIKNLVLKDYIVIDGSNLDPAGRISDITVSGGGLSVTLPGALTYEDNRYFILALDGTLASGATSTVTYTVDYSDAALGSNYNVTYTNYADVKGRDVISNAEVEGNGTVSGNLLYSDGNLIITKSIISPYDLTTRTIEFEINVTAQGENLKDIVITDYMWNNSHGSYFDSTNSSITINSVTVNGIDIPYSISYSVGTEKAFELDFGAYVLAADDTIKINYTFDATDFIDTYFVHPYSYYFTNEYTNTADVSAKNNSDWTLTGSSSVNDKIERLFVGKKGRTTGQSTSNAGIVTWYDWFVGDGKTPINGAVITDTLTDLVAMGDQTLTFTIKKDDDTTTTMSLFVPGGSGGFSFTVPEATDIDPLTGDPYGTIVKITLNGDYINGNFVTIVTRVSDMPTYSSTWNTYNRITVEIGGKSIYYEISMVAYRPSSIYEPQIRKWHAFVEDPVTGEKSIEFTMYMPGASFLWYNYGKLLFITDTHSINTSHGTYYAPCPKRSDISMTFEDSNGMHSYTDFDVIDESPAIWYIVFQPNITDPNQSTSPFTMNTHLTITYRVPLNTTLFKLESGLYVETDQILEQVLTENPTSHFYRNMAQITYKKLHSTGNGTSSMITDAYWPIIKKATVKPDGVTVDYELTLRTTSQSFSGYTSYSGIGVDPIFTDTFDSRMEYVPHTFIATYTNYNYLYCMYAEDNDTAHNGIVKPDLLETNPSQYFTVNGNKTTMTIDLRELKQINSSGGWTSGVPFTNRVFTPTSLSWYNPSTGVVTVSYSLRLKSDVGGTHIVNNTAKYMVDSSASATVTGASEVDKNMVVNSGNTAAVTIEINPNSHTYADGDRYTAKDIMSANLAPFVSTIKIETQNGGTWTEQPINTTPGELYSYTVVGTNRIDFVLPDNIPVRITYIVLVKGEIGDTVPVKNEIWVCGFYDESTIYQFVISSTSAYGSGSRSTLQLHKYDAADSSVSLQGARFALYIALKYPGWDTVSVPQDAPRTYNVGATTFYYVGDGGYAITNAAGDFIFNNAWLRPDSVTYSYLLLETRAPVGYSLPSTPYTLFSYVPTSPIGGNQVIQASDLITRPNSKLFNVYATIFGNKTVETDPADIDAPYKLFTFRLTQVKDEHGTSMDNPYTALATTVGAGEFGFPLSNLKPNTTYYYKITEDIDGSDKNWAYDPLAETGYIVTVTVASNGNTTVTYPNGGNEINFTNTYSKKEQSGGPLLPETGGIGTLPFILTGISLFMIMAVSLGIIKNKAAKQ